MRTVTLNLVIEDMVTLPQVAGKQAHQVIGRLSTWGWSYPDVGIYRDGLSDMVAVYRREDGTQGYAIGAVWNPDSKTYSFHS